MGWPSRSMTLPFAARVKTSCARPVTTSWYATPVTTVRIASIAIDWRMSRVMIVSGSERGLQHHEAARAADVLRVTRGREARGAPVERAVVGIRRAEARGPA